MNHILYYITVILLPSLGYAQDYSNLPGSYQDPYNPNYKNQDVRPTDDYLNIQSNSNYDPNKYTNPYDPNRNQYGSENNYDPTRPRYDPTVDQNRYNRNQYENRNDVNVYGPDNTPRPAWDTGRKYETGYSRAAPLEHDSVIINDA